MFEVDSLISRRLSKDFYQQPTLTLAPALLGKYLVVNRNNQLKVVRITETEAYIGEDDLASHARFGRTKRNEIMYGPPGRLYIYLIYGIHYLLNIISEPEGSPAGILIRAGKLIADKGDVTNFSRAVIRGATAEGREHDKIPLRADIGLLNGPGKFTRALAINKSDFDLDLTTSNEIFIADSGIIPEYTTAPRVGIDYAPEPWKSIRWRFICR